MSVGPKPPVVCAAGEGGCTTAVGGGGTHRGVAARPAWRRARRPRLAGGPHLARRAEAALEAVQRRFQPKKGKRGRAYGFEERMRAGPGAFEVRPRRAKGRRRV